MYNGDCYPNGSYFRDTEITIPAESMFPNSDYLQRVLPNSTLSKESGLDLMEDLLTVLAILTA